MKVLIPLVCLLVGALLVGTGDYFSKRWALNGGGNILLSIVAYTLPLSMWFILIKQMPQLAKVTLLWSLATTLAGCFVGLVIFREHFSMLNIIGGILAVASIALLTWQ
jgi:drug/metabolite transporter (DMT)-like permease